ncbi:MAG TPA: exopolysaccharide biosynthesis protein [bacterium]|nr:exopolysaccharide biosynthesis protein [bacterium]
MNKGKTLSAILAEMLRGDDPVTVGELADRVQRRGFGLLMIVLALPTFIPVLPPGVAVVVGLLYFLLGVQMLWGLPQPWLPQRVRAYRLTGRGLRRLRERGVPLLRRLEELSRERPLPIDEGIITRAIAVVMCVIGVILVLPIPFFNTLPALSVLALGVGLLNRDALFLVAGLAIASGAIAVVVFGAGALWAVYEWLRDRLR